MSLSREPRPQANSSTFLWGLIAVSILTLTFQITMDDRSHDSYGLYLCSEDLTDCELLTWTESRKECHTSREAQRSTPGTLACVRRLAFDLE